MKTRWLIGLMTLGIALAWLPGTVHAQARQRYPNNPGYPGTYSSGSQVAYDQGYREGVTLGERDGRAGRNYDYQRHGAYRNSRGSWGYGSGNDQREAFRRGFAEGYQAGYARYSRGGYGQYGRNYPTYPGYPGGAYGGYGSGGYGYNSQAYDRGFKDGYDEGRKAGRGNDRYDPYREKDYRKGDKGYNRRYGGREAYERVYRDGFLAGYDRGYGESRYSNNSRGWPW